MLKRKLSTYVSDRGRLLNVPEELLLEIVNAWEGWTGTAILDSQHQMASLLGKAKRLKREGYYGTESFKEVAPPPPSISRVVISRIHQCQCIELETSKGQVIRFPAVEMLMEFLEKAG